jgi:hypothetical protein
MQHELEALVLFFSQRPLHCSHSFLLTAIRVYVSHQLNSSSKNLLIVYDTNVLLDIIMPSKNYMDSLKYRVFIEEKVEQRLLLYTYLHEVFVYDELCVVISPIVFGFLDLNF